MVHKGKGRLSSQEENQTITSLKRCKAQEPASSSGNGPTGGDENSKKRMRQDMVQISRATSACGTGDQVEVVGRTSRTRATAVPARFRDSGLINSQKNESFSGIDSSDKGENSKNGGIALVPESAKSKWLLPRHANSSENEAVKEASHMKDGKTESKKRNDPCLPEDLGVGDVIWAKVSKSSAPWPAIVIDPREHAPESVMNACIPSAICVMFLGHTATGTRDYGWVKAGMMFSFLDNVDRFQGQKLGKLRERFVEAIEEAFLAERGFFELESLYAEGPACSESADVAPGSSHGQEGSSNGGKMKCKGCGRNYSLLKNKKFEFDQSLCIACSKLYKERRYCGVCERVWYDTDRGSFTQCDGCEIWVHTECIKTHTEEELKTIKYFCPACMAKGKKKAASGTPSSVDITRCEEENSIVELQDLIPVFLDHFEGIYLRKEHMILCNCSHCNGTKLTPARFESHTGSKRKNWKLCVKVKGTEEKLDDVLDGKKPIVVKTTKRNAPTTMKQKLEDLLQEPYMPVHARWTTEVCAICWWVEDWDYNKIIICNRCQMAVHQECYGARDVNDLTSWVCRACEDLQVKRSCCLCPVKGGALKRTDVGDFWVHVTCTWFQPKMNFVNDKTMEPALGLLSVPLDSFKKKCVICEQVHGACTKCCKCNIYYHAMCATRAGYRMELHSYESHGTQISRFYSYCPSHGGVAKNNGLVLYSNEEVYLSMAYKRNIEKPSCSRLVRRDTEKHTAGCPETDLPSTSSQEDSCARCRVYHRTDRKRTREEAVLHRTMGPRQHSLDVIESLNVHPKDLGPTDFSTFDERLRYLKKNENHRVCCGKSGIHGWGLFARRPIQGGEMIIEYLGEQIRRSICNAREARYQAENKDCYFFTVSDEFVLDATRKGSVARLINHSCQPNCYARIVTGNGKNRIVFVAKEDIPAGQELTFDYMFNTDESDDNRVKCRCQAPNCRGYMA